MAKVNEDPWLGSDETYTKKIAGKEVTFRAKPLTKHFKGIILNPNKDVDAQNYELVKAVVVKPEITKEYWDNMYVAVKAQLMEEVGKILGVSVSFPEQR